MSTRCARTVGSTENGVAPNYEKIFPAIPFDTAPDAAGCVLDIGIAGLGLARYDVVPPVAGATLLGWGLESSDVEMNASFSLGLVDETDNAVDIPITRSGPGPEGTTTLEFGVAPSMGTPVVPEVGDYHIEILATTAGGATAEQGRVFCIWDMCEEEGPVVVGLAPAAIVAAPSLSPAPHSLIETSISVPEPSIERMGQEVEAWTAGFQFQPEACDQGGMWVPCIDTKTSDLNPGGSGSGSGDQLKSEFDAPDFEEFIPYWVEGQFTCSTRGFQVAEYAERALRSLELVTPKQVEHEFWTGDQMADHPQATNQALVTEVASRAQILNSGSIGVFEPVSPTHAFALLQQGLANCATGSRGMIHATPYLVELFIANYLVVQDGQNLSSSSRGTYVVSGGGYPGSGPTIAAGQAEATGTLVWAFATGMVNIRLGEVKLYPNEQDIASDLAEAMRPRNGSSAHGWDNEITYRAERAAAAVWDPCCTVAVLVDVCADDR